MVLATATPEMTVQESDELTDAAVVWGFLQALDDVPASVDADRAYRRKRVEMADLFDSLGLSSGNLRVAAARLFESEGAGDWVPPPA